MRRPQCLVGRHQDVVGLHRSLRAHSVETNSALTWVIARSRDQCSQEIEYWPLAY